MPRFSLHARFGRVLFPHPLALLGRDHFQREFIVIAQEGAPLAILRDGRRAAHDLGHVFVASLFERHVDARHDREVKAHVEFIAVPEIWTHIFRLLIGFAKQNAARIMLVHEGT